jgi:hypothetical protein
MKARFSSPVTALMNKVGRAQRISRIEGRARMECLRNLRDIAPLLFDTAKRN